MGSFPCGKRFDWQVHAQGPPRFRLGPPWHGTPGAWGRRGSPSVAFFNHASRCASLRPDQLWARCIVRDGSFWLLTVLCTTTFVTHAGLVQMSITLLGLQGTRLDPSNKATPTAIQRLHFPRRSHPNRMHRPPRAAIIMTLHSLSGLVSTNFIKATLASLRRTKVTWGIISQHSSIVTIRTPSRSGRQTLTSFERCP